MPWGDFPDDEPEQRPIGLWGQRHLRYIKQHRRSLYAELLMNGKLNDYLSNLDSEAEEMFSRLVKQITGKRDITEKLKAADQMRWVQEMNNIRNSASEIINTELIYI